MIFQRADAAAAAAAKAKNVIVQWERPTVRVRQEFKDLGVVRANPSEYSARYGATLKRTADLPLFVRDMKPPQGLTLAGQAAVAYELEGDLHALKLIDLESEGTRLTFVSIGILLDSSLLLLARNELIKSCVRALSQPLFPLFSTIFFCHYFFFHFFFSTFFSI